MTCLIFLQSEDEYFNEEVIRLAVLLIGDLAKLCGSRVLDGLTQAFIKNLIDKCKMHAVDERMRDAAKFASDQVFAVTGRRI